jgi:hypothetical protein
MPRPSLAAIAALLALAACEGGGEQARGVRISTVAVYQGPEVRLVSGADLVVERRAPLLIGRPARVVVTVQAASGAEPRDVNVELTLGDDETGDELLLTQRAAVGAEAEAGVEVVFELDEAALRPASTFAAEVVEVDGFESALDLIDGVRQPDTGSWRLDVRAAPRFRVQLLPVALPGENLPALDDARLERWRATLHAWLPVSEVEMTVADEPLEAERDLSEEVQWALLLGDVAAWRERARLDDDVFVYGVVGYAPQLSGIAGIAATVAVEAPYWRVAAGILEPVDEAENVLVAHELGHALGRSHAPCGNPGGPDRNYPYENASIGVAGVDLRDGVLRAPELYVDFMSYCQPAFVSDYQFGALWSSLTWLESGAAARRTAPVDPAFVIDRLPGGAP